MIMVAVKLSDVSLTIPIYDHRAKSARHKIVDFAIGGVIDNKDSITHVNVLNDINMRVSEGETLGLYGHNGSGKTSLLKVISGIYFPTSGTCETLGNVRALLNVNEGLEPSLDGVENIIRIGLMGGFTYKDIKEQLEEIIEFSGLSDFIYMPVRTYSSGMRMRLIFSVITSGKADILLLDEFFTAGDEEFMTKSKKRINGLIQNSKILIMASHSKHLINAYCSRVIIMTKGNVREISKIEFSNT